VKREIRRIEPMSAMRVGFLVGLLSGVVLGLLQALLLKMLAGSAGGALIPPEAQQFIGMSGGMVVVLAIVTGLLCSLVFALAGALTALFYNLAARMFGGIEVYSSGADEEGTKRRDPARDEDRDHE
jgi:hypothetical protein